MRINLQSDNGRRLALLAVFVFTLWANIKTPLWGDDYCRVIPPSFTAPFVLAWRDYFAWTGRFFATVATYFAVEVSRYWSALPFDTINAAMFVALVLNVLTLAQRAGDAGRRAGALEVGFVALLLWWLPRDFAEVALWKTGSIGYLWAVTGELWVLRLTLERSPERRVWVLLCAFVIATFLETLSLLISGVLLLWCVGRWRRGRTAPWGLAAAHAAGTVMVLAAPGNFVRAATLPPSPPLDRLAGVVGLLGSLFDPFWIVAAVVVVFACWSRPWRWPVLRAGRGWIFALAALLYMGVLLGVPRASLAARVAFPASVFLVCYIVALFLRRPAFRMRERMAGVVAMLWVASCAVVVPHLDRLAQISAAWADDPQLKMGPGMNAVLPLVRVGGRLVYTRKDRFFEGITTDPGYFVNVCFARAYGVKSVVAGERR